MYVEQLTCVFDEFTCRGALLGKLEVFESLQPLVAHSGHSGNFLGTDLCSLQLFLECRSDSHGSQIAKQSQTKAGENAIFQIL